VHLGGGVPFADQRTLGAGGHRNVAASHVIEHANRVRGRLLERLIARHGRHAEQLELGTTEREQ
jgi:hypothetical protein